MCRKDQGFTLIELMIVVAIIAIIAAIAIPSLLRSRLAANEVSAVGTLRNLVAVEAAWRQNDSDRNGVSDYWTGDVSCFYRFLDRAGNALAAMDLAVANADSLPLTALAGLIGPDPLGGSTTAIAKSGYLYRVMATANVDAVAPAGADPYQTNSAPADGVVAENATRFGFAAYPETYNTSGVNVYFVIEDGVIRARDQGNNGETSGATSVGVIGTLPTPTPAYFMRATNGMLGGQGIWPGALGTTDPNTGGQTG